MPGLGSLAGRARKAAERGARIPQRRRALQRLETRGDAAARALAAALRGDPVAGEQEWVDSIEALRRELLASEEVIVVHAAEYSGDETDERQVVETVGQTCRSASKPPAWGLVLLRLVATARPASALELGTCLGLSAAYQAAGLRLAGGAGRLVTLEAAQVRAERSGDHLRRLGLDDVARVVRGRFTQTLPGALEELGTVDYAFLDGHHDEAATADYWEQIAPRVAPGGIVVVDDVRWSDGMARAWERIVADERVTLALDLGDVGICVLQGEGERERIAIPLS